jgi:hypothetical protein
MINNNLKYKIFEYIETRDLSSKFTMNIRLYTYYYNRILKDSAYSPEIINSLAKIPFFKYCCSDKSPPHKIVKINSETFLLFCNYEGISKKKSLCVFNLDTHQFSRKVHLNLESDYIDFHQYYCPYSGFHFLIISDDNWIVVFKMNNDFDLFFELTLENNLRENGFFFHPLEGFYILKITPDYNLQLLNQTGKTKSLIVNPNQIKCIGNCFDKLLIMNFIVITDSDSNISFIYIENWELYVYKTIKSSTSELYYLRVFENYLCFHNSTFSRILIIDIIQLKEYKTITLENRVQKSFTILNDSILAYICTEGKIVIYDYKTEKTIREILGTYDYKSLESAYHPLYGPVLLALIPAKRFLHYFIWIEIFRIPKN